MVAIIAGLGASLSGYLPLVVADAGSLTASGKTVDAHTPGVISGKHCRVTEGIAREDRKICELRGSSGTENELKGLTGVTR